jgi:hypothetical protein
VVVLWRCRSDGCGVWNPILFAVLVEGAASGWAPRLAPFRVTAYRDCFAARGGGWRGGLGSSSSGALQVTSITLRAKSLASWSSEDGAKHAHGEARLTARPAGDVVPQLADLVPRPAVEVGCETGSGRGVHLGHVALRRRALAQ